jgi:hypothetical protein
MFVEVCILFLLPFVYMSLYTADRYTAVTEVAAGCVVLFAQPGTKLLSAGNHRITNGKGSYL